MKTMFGICLLTLAFSLQPSAFAEGTNVLCGQVETRVETNWVITHYITEAGGAHVGPGFTETFRAGYYVTNTVAIFPWKDEQREYLLESKTNKISFGSARFPYELSGWMHSPGGMPHPPPLPPAPAAN